MNDVCMRVCILGWFLHKRWLLTCPSINKAFYLFIIYVRELDLNIAFKINLCFATNNIRW